MKKNTDSLLKLLQETLDAYKAEDIRVISISEPLVAEAFVVATGTSSRHIDALAEKVREALKKARIKVKLAQPSKESGWSIIDLGSVMVHLFLKDVREHYRIEDLWKNMPTRTEDTPVS